jgi:hypothetical protein
MWTRATDLLDKAGIEPHAVDLSVLVPLLESGSLQEDERMSERWAALLAAAASGLDSIPPSYPDILRQLTPREAAILDGLYEQAGDTWPEAYHEPDLFARKANFPLEGVVLSTENLLRQRLVKSRALNFPGATSEDSKIALTVLGHDFVRACRPPTPRP